MRRRGLLSIIRKSYLSDKKQTGFLPSCDCVSITVWMHHMDTHKMHKEKAWWELHKMQRAILKKSWKQQSTKQQLYGHLPPISKTIQVRWTRHVGHASVGRPVKTLHQLCADTGCRLEDLPRAANNRCIVRESRKSVVSAWLTYIYIYIYIYTHTKTCWCIWCDSYRLSYGHFYW